MMWREPRNHRDDFYFCAVNDTDINLAIRNNSSYPALLSTRPPVPHYWELSIPLTSSIVFKIESREEKHYHRKDFSLL